MDPWMTMFLSFRRVGSPPRLHGLVSMQLPQVLVVPVLNNYLKLTTMVTKLTTHGDGVVS